MEHFLHIMERDIDLSQSPIIAQGPCSIDELKRDWEYQNGVWTVENGWICGKHSGNSGGLLYSKRH